MFPSKFKDLALDLGLRIQGVKLQNLMLGGAILALLSFIEVHKWRPTGQFYWPVLMVALEVGVGILLWFKFPSLKRVIGEGKSKKRPRYRYGVNLLLFFLFLAPFSIYVLESLQPKPLYDVVNLSIIGISLALAGLSFAASSISPMTAEKRVELICVAQKFIGVTILFLLFIPLIYMIDALYGGIDINAVSFLDPTAWLRGIFFWIAAPCFYGAVVLFLLGVSDLIFALSDLGKENPADLL